MRSIKNNLQCCWVSTKERTLVVHFYKMWILAFIYLKNNRIIQITNKRSLKLHYCPCVLQFEIEFSKTKPFEQSFEKTSRNAVILMKTISSLPPKFPPPTLRNISEKHLVYWIHSSTSRKVLRNKRSLQIFSKFTCEIQV